MHSWDMINIKNSRTSRVCSKDDFKEKIVSFLEYSSKKLNYITMGELYEKIKNS